MHDRRTFLRAAAVLPLTAPQLFAKPGQAPLFRISLAQWSHHRAFRGQSGAVKLDPLKFAEIARKDYGITAVEYVNSFYKDHKKNDAYLNDLKKVADDQGVVSVLIMCDGEGALGDADVKKREVAVDNHKRWVEWAKYLGCHSIRVNAQSSGSYEEQIDRAADGLRKLSDFGDSMGINVIVENHGGLSSHGAWLAAVMKKVDHKRCGTLPDFGNFTVRRADKNKPGDKDEVYDRYQGVDELMPWAKGVSAKSHDFDAKGNEIHTDYRRMLDIVVKKHQYHGYIGIEYEGAKMSEADGIRATKKLLETVMAEMS